MNKKRNTIIVLVLLLLVVLTGSVISGTYAKYTSNLDDATATVKVAKWAFSEDNENALQNIEIALANTVDASTLLENRIAPGTSGKFDIELVNTNTEVGVDFTISMKSMENVPSNLKFYADSNYTKVFDINNNITGQLAAADDTGITASIYWVWDYEQDDILTGDEVDTTDGMNANDMTVVISVNGTQTQPSNTKILTHIN